VNLQPLQQIQRFYKSNKRDSHISRLAFAKLGVSRQGHKETLPIYAPSVKNRRMRNPHDILRRQIRCPRTLGLAAMPAANKLSPQGAHEDEAEEHHLPVVR
jgi:hypothetical protein